ncbi:MAG TPA: toxin-antitoxin system HicB family antitoxin [Mycobacteriales bacterium]|nr:toxin-antitoxin system HicB family antitoxin [Mycobacteriales bacterium]
MNLSPYVEALRRGLAAAAAAGTDETRRAADLLASAVEPSVRLALLEALAAAVAEVNEAVSDITVEVRLRGQEPEVVVSESGPAAEAPPPVDTDETLSRVTLRLPETVKSRVERAAAAEGVSVNAWLVRAISRELGQSTRQSRGRRTFTGYVRG